MNKNISIKGIILILLMIGTFSTFASGIVFDPTNYQQAIQNGATAISSLNTSTKTLDSMSNTLELAKKNSQGLGISNWSDVSDKISEINGAADIANSMTFATSSAVNTFDQLFPGDAETGIKDYTQIMTQRSFGVLNTLKGNLSAVQGLGNSIKEYGSTLKKLNQAQGKVSGHESAQEQSNQIQGNILNNQQFAIQSALATGSNQAAYYAFRVQQSQEDINNQKKFLGNFKGSSEYKDNGQGAISSGWY